MNNGISIFDDGNLDDNYPEKIYPGIRYHFNDISSKENLYYLIQLGKLLAAIATNSNIKLRPDFNNCKFIQRLV